MPTVTSKDGTQIAFEKIGQGPAVILVDGALCYRAHWGQGPLAQALATHFTVYTFDRRGRGESGDTQPYTVEREIEDIAALVDEASGKVYLYGVSSGSVLALRAAAQLGADKIAKLALYEPPFNTDDDQDLQAFADYTRQTTELLGSGKRGDAVALFMADMMPPDMLEEMRQSPEWPLLEAIAPTLAYDNAVMGDGAVPVSAAQASDMPTLILVTSGSPAFKHEAVESLISHMPRARLKTLEVELQGFAPEIAAPALIEFFTSATNNL
jgi:pimeloyl-ACP methyl ester carboxylesterase